MSLFRQSAIDRARASFPAAEALEPAISDTVGGRSTALAVLRRINPVRYAATRNRLDGAVTRLSPYIRHGCLTLAEVRDHVLARATREQADKLLSELAWRDYYQRVYELLGEGLWRDIEAYKTGLGAGDYAPGLPPDVRAGATGLACMDAFVTELHATGYIHNHARMWLASYLVHHRRIAWQAGAQWFLEHLLDGDVASNNLSWQWVASTFSHKPYLFNRSNLERYTDSRHCQQCPARQRCPFAGEYEELSARLFTAVSGAQSSRPLKVLATRPEPTPGPAGGEVAWAHEDALSSTHPAYQDVPTLVIHDLPWLQSQRYTLKRCLFLLESADDTGLEQAVGDPVPLLLDFARRHDAATVRVPATPSTRIKSLAELLTRQGLRVRFVPAVPFLRTARPTDLTRFTRYWNLASRDL
jgi:deoxyribodipyrimidine photo-lyase